MILTCPSCHTRFQADEAALRRPGGRLVRCASCGHTWRHVVDVAAPLRAPPAPAPIPAPALSAEARDAAPAALPPPRRSSHAAVAAVVVIVLLAAAILLAIVERRAIVARYPAAARLYADAGLPLERPSAVLKIEKIRPVRTADGLIIKGEISNSGHIPHTLPRLRVALEDAARKEVQFKIIAPPKDKLQPGEVAHFETPFAHPVEAAKNVIVTFAAR